MRPLKIMGVGEKKLWELLKKIIAQGKKLNHKIKNYNTIKIRLCYKSR